MRPHSKLSSFLPPPMEGLPRLLLPLVLVALTFAPVVAKAGGNAGASVQLSWSPDAYQADTPLWVDSDRLLYLRISGTPDLTALLLKIEWTPNSAYGPGYSLVPPISEDLPCSARFAADSVLVFDSDSSVYAGSLPPLHPSTFCIVYKARATASAPAAGRILVTYAIAIDHAGLRDTLFNIGDVTIAGGGDTGAPLANDMPMPGLVLEPAPDQEVTIIGPRTDSSTQLALLVNGTLIQPNSATPGALPASASSGVSAPHSARATFDLTGVGSTNVRVLIGASGIPGLYDSTAFSIRVRPRLYEAHSVGLGIDSEVHGASWEDWTPLNQVTFADSALGQILQAAGAVAIKSLSSLPADSNIVRTLPSGAVLRIPRASNKYYSLLLPDTSVAAALGVLQNATSHVRNPHQHWLLTEPSSPTDNLYPQQWGLHNTGQFGGVIGADIGAEVFWGAPICQICYPTKIAIIDTGLDGTHPEFTGRLFEGGRVDDRSGGTLDPQHIGSHGTKVAGIVGATWNNGGIAGVYPRALMTSVIWNSDPPGTPLQIAEAIRYINEDNTQFRLANISAGGPSSSQLDAAVRDAYLLGITLVAASGNANQRGLQFPAANQGALGVGAVYVDGLRWNDQFVDWGGGVPPSNLFGSNYGPGLAIVAPGGQFITTTAKVAEGSFVTVDRAASSYGFNGTSAATPVVTGVIARLTEEWQLLSPDDIRQVLIRTATDVVGRDAINATPNAPPPDNKYDEATGYGIINPALAYDFLAGANMEFISTTGANVVATASQGFVYNPSVRQVCGGTIQSGNRHMTRYTMQSTAALKPYPWLEPYTSPPTVWAVNSGSNGMDENLQDMSAYAWYPSVRVVSVTADSVTLESHLYRDDQSLAWWPTCPSNLVMSCTAYARSQYYTGVANAGRGGDGLRLSARAVGGGIELSITGVSGVGEVELYDVAGRRLWRQRDVRVMDGVARVRWDGNSDGRRVAPGLVFARARVGTFVARAKAVIVF